MELYKSIKSIQIGLLALYRPSNAKFQPIDPHLFTFLDIHRRLSLNVFSHLVTTTYHHFLVLKVHRLYTDHRVPAHWYNTNL